MKEGHRSRAPERRCGCWSAQDARSPRPAHAQQQLSALPAADARRGVEAQHSCSTHRRRHGEGGSPWVGSGACRDDPGGGPVDRRHHSSDRISYTCQGVLRRRGWLWAVALLLLLQCWARGAQAFTCQGSCPDDDVQKLSYGGNVTITIIKAINLPNKDRFGPFSGVSDPYVKVTVGSTSHTTRTISNTLNPTWNEDLHLGMQRSKADLQISVFDGDSGLEFGDDALGTRQMNVPFCSMFSAPTRTYHCETPQYTYCSAPGSSWHYPQRLYCNETGWLALDGGDDTACSDTASTPCLHLRISIVPFVVKIEEQHASGTLSTTVAGYSGGVGYSWATNYGYMFADSLQRIDSSNFLSTELIGGVMIRTHTTDKNLVDTSAYIGFSMNFAATVWVCRYTKELDYEPSWLSSWERTEYRVTYIGGAGLIEWQCYRKVYPATGKNQYNYLTSSPVYLYGNKPATLPSTTLMTRQYVVIVVPIMAGGSSTTSTTYNTTFNRGSLWKSIAEFYAVFLVFALLVNRYLSKDVGFRLDRVESVLMNHATTGFEDNLLGSLFLGYNETKYNMEFRRNLYWCTVATRFSICIPLVILWLWGIVAIHTVTPSAIGWAILLVGNSLVLGSYGFSLWRSMGWCMTSTGVKSLAMAAASMMAFVVVVVFANPAVMAGYSRVDFLSLSAVFGTLNLIPLIFRAFSQDRSLARSVAQLLASVGIAAKSTGPANVAGTAATKQKELVTTVRSSYLKPSSPSSSDGKSSSKQTGGKKRDGSGGRNGQLSANDQARKALGAATASFNTLLGACYSIHISVAGFEHADMVAVILKRCTGQVMKMSTSLYGCSVMVLFLYASIASGMTSYVTLAWVNAMCLLYLDLVHFLLSRGTDSWAPGKDAAIMAGGRMLVMIISGKYWLIGYSLTYMLYGYALTESIINKYLPRMTKAEAGGVAFFGMDSFARMNLDIASSPVFAFGLLSFGFVFVLLVCAFVKPAGLPQPLIPVGGMLWAVHVFGLLALLFILITCLARATSRAFYLYRQNLLMGAFRDSYFWWSGVRVPIVLAVATQVFVVCSGLLMFAATRSSLIFILSIFVPPIVLIAAFLYTKWASNDYVLIPWPPNDDFGPKGGGDDTMDDPDVAYHMIGSLLGGPASPVGGGASPSPGTVKAGAGATFNFDKLTQMDKLTPGGAGASRGNAKVAPEPPKTFELPALTKTGKEILGEIKMPALPLKANFKRKEKKDDAELEELANLGLFTTNTTNSSNNNTTQKQKQGEAGGRTEGGKPGKGAKEDDGKRGGGKKGYKSAKRRPRVREWAAQNACLKWLNKRTKKLRQWHERRARRHKIAAKAAAMEEGGAGVDMAALSDGPTLAEVSVFRAAAEGWLTNDEYMLFFAYPLLVLLVVVMGAIIAAVNEPPWMGHLVWSMALVGLWTAIPIIKWFSAYEFDRWCMAHGIGALLLFWLSLTIFFIRSLDTTLDTTACLWVLTAMIGYPLAVLWLTQVLSWRDNGYAITARKANKADGEVDNDFSLVDALQALISLGAPIVFIWEIAIFTTSQNSAAALSLLYVLAVLAFIFLRDWAANDYYLSPRYQWFGNVLVNVGMFVSLLVGLTVNVDLLICVSMFFLLYILREAASIAGRKIMMEPDVPMYISPYIFPVYSYSPRTNDLVDETGTAVRLYGAMLMVVLWGVCFAIFVTPQSLGVCLACIAIIATVVMTAVLIQQVPLALGTSSRFLDAGTIVDAADTARQVSTRRKKPVQFECAEWEEMDHSNPMASTSPLPSATEELQTAADIATHIDTQVTSLRKTISRRGEGDKLHSDALYTTKDAMAEAMLTGRGPLGMFGCDGAYYRCLSRIRIQADAEGQSSKTRGCLCCCRCCRSLKNYDEDGQLVNVDILKRRFDSQEVLLSLPDLDQKLGHGFYEELRCVIHLWLLLIVAADARLRREKVLFQKFLRENRFKLLSNGIAPPKSIFSSASFASIDISLVAVWLSTLTPEERERFHLLKSKFSEEQAARDGMVDRANIEDKAEAEALLARRRAREEDMCKRRYADIVQRREARLARWSRTLLQEDQRKVTKFKSQWMRAAGSGPGSVLVAKEDAEVYRAFLDNVLVQGADEALLCAREALQEVESAERGCKAGSFGRVFQYYDADFPLGPSSIGRDVGIDVDALTWSVSLAMNADATLFDESGTDPDDVFRGRLSDGWLLSALSMLAAAGGVGDGSVDEQIQQLFVGFAGADGKSVFRTSVGAYGVRMFKNGQWETVIIDDFFPIIKGQEEEPITRGAAFSYTKEFRELWVPVVEKAMAKYYGSYGELSQGYVHHGLRDLTGCDSEEIHLSKASRGIGKRSLWDLLVRSRRNGYILGAGSISSALADRQILDTGLVFGAAYTIYDVREVDQHQLLKLRNPPGDHDEWKGDWGDKSKLWTKRYRKKLGFTNENDNTFWMSFDDFCIAFNSLYVCRWHNPKVWRTKELKGAWKVADPESTDADTSAGLPSRHNLSCELEHNPQYELIAHRKTDVMVTLAQVDASGLASPSIHPVAMYVLSQRLRGTKAKRGTPVTAITAENLFASTGPPVRERSQSLYATLEPGAYVLMCATYLPGMEGPFTMKVVHNFALEINQLWPPVAKEGMSLAEKLAAKAIKLAETAHDMAASKGEDEAIAGKSGGVSGGGGTPDGGGGGVVGSGVRPSFRRSVAKKPARPSLYPELGEKSLV